MKARWNIKMKYDGVPIIDASDVKDEDLKKIFKLAKIKTG